MACMTATHVSVLPYMHAQHEMVPNTSVPLPCLPLLKRATFVCLQPRLYSHRCSFLANCHYSRSDALYNITFIASSNNPCTGQSHGTCCIA
jgi:hypothetical protein